MKYSEKLKNEGFEMKIRKECEDGEGYDLYLTVSKGDSFLEVFYSMSNSKLLILQKNIIHEVYY